MKGFSGLPITRWEEGSRIMTLIEELSYTDRNNTEWKVKKGAELNGATIPRALWSVIGSPYVGRYRRASIVHDYFVGEGSNPDVSYSERRKADKMFFRACRADGCSLKFATLLYIGVSVGSWASRKNMRTLYLSPEELDRSDIENSLGAMEDEAILQKYHEVVNSYLAEKDRNISNARKLRSVETEEEDQAEALERTVEGYL